MKKKYVLVSVCIIALLFGSAWLVNVQFNNLQSEIVGLKEQNSELENQVKALQDQNQLMKDRILQLLEQFSESYNSPLHITDFEWIGGFNPYVGLTLFYPVNVTIQNSGALEARGLSMVVKLVNMYDGRQIGHVGGTSIDTLLPGELREIQTGAYANLDLSLADAVCVLTLKQGNTVIDEWIRSIN